MSSGGDPTAPHAAAAEISQQLSAIHREFYGTPVLGARTHVVDDLVITVLDIELTGIERRMVALGRAEAVLALRQEVQRAEDTSFTAAIERATGRRVTAFLSNTHLDPPFVVEIFRLSPPSPDPDAPARHRSRHDPARP